MKNLILLFIILATLQVAAQSKTITGVVTDETNQPLPGVNVMVEGTSKGTQTDFDGNYSIVAHQGQTLVFNYIGFKTSKIKIGTSNVVNVSMKEDSQALEEVVIVGYGSYVTPQKSPPSPTQIKRQKRKEYHSSIAQTLQGKVAGVKITNNSVSPSAPPNIRIRGLSSIKAGKEPMYIVDGVPIQKINNSA